LRSRGTANSASLAQFLEKLDGKEVVQNHRDMLKNLVAFKSRGMRRDDGMDGMMIGDATGGGMGMDMGMTGTGMMGGGGGFGSPDNGDWGAEGGEGVMDFVDGGFR
jgi:hypothetical protein